MDKIRIVVADDHHILLDGLRALLQKQKDVEVAGLYDNGLDLYNALATTQPQVALVDISMPGLSGHELTLKIKETHPSINVIALSMYDDAGHIMDMIEAGVSGYLLKNVNDRELLEAIRTVANGKMYFSSEVSEKITALVVRRQQKQEQPEEARLTEREIEVLKLVADELSNAQIAERLFISERTVETHRKNMLRKTNNKSIVGLLKYAMEKHLI
jgi:DNA-binding NarL/FixJ family response regulator